MNIYNFGSIPTRLVNQASTVQKDINNSIEKISTGRITGGSDLPTTLIPKSARLASQIASTSAAVKNVVESLSILELADATLDEVQDTLSRLNEITVQAANTLTTSAERAAITEETSLLTAQIENLSRSTEYQNRRLLDGTLANFHTQTGTRKQDSFSFFISSLNPGELGSFIKPGVTRGALAAAQDPTANTTTASEDIVLVGPSFEATIDVAANDSAKTVTEKVNGLSPQTGIFADAESYALLSSTNANSENYIVKINETSTSSFAISSSSVTDAVSKINLISATTGVSASATAANKVLLFDSDGDDITIENGSSGTSLEVEAVQADGATSVGSAVSLLAGSSTNNDATRVIGTLRLTSDKSFSITQSGNSSLAYMETGGANLNSLEDVDLSSTAAAAQSLTIITSAANQIALMRGRLTGFQQRLQFSESFLHRNQENLKLAVSQIEDTDFALESAKLSKQLVLQHANAALLAQANASSAMVLKLLDDAA